MSERESEEPAETASLLSGLGGVLAALRTLVTDVAELAALETRLAGHALALMIALGAAAALFLVTAWLLVVAVAVGWLVRLGLTWEAATLIMAGVQVGLAVLMVVLGRRASRHLLFEGTRGALFRGAGDESDEPPDPVPEGTGQER